MNTTTAKKVLTDLLNGVNPISGEELIEARSFRDPEVLRVLSRSATQLTSLMRDQLPDLGSFAIPLTKRVAVSSIVEAMKHLRDPSQRAYLNPLTGAIFEFSEEEGLCGKAIWDSALTEPERERLGIIQDVLSSPEWFPIEIDPWAVDEREMQSQFVDQVDDKSIQTTLSQAIQGGDTGQFREALSDTLMESDWTSFCEVRWNSLAWRWLKECEVAYCGFRIVLRWLLGATF